MFILKNEGKKLFKKKKNCLLINSIELAPYEEQKNNVITNLVRSDLVLIGE